MRSDWASSARWTDVAPWPRRSAPKPATRSTYRLPSTSYTFEPRPDERTIGVGESPERALRRRVKAGHSMASRRAAALRDSGPGGGVRISGGSLPELSSSTGPGNSLSGGIGPSRLGFVEAAVRPPSASGTSSGAHAIATGVLRLVQLLV